VGPTGPLRGFGMGVGRKSSAHPLRLNTNSRVHICKHVWKYVYRTGEYLYSRQGHSVFEYELETHMSCFAVLLRIFVVLLAFVEM